MALPTQKDLNSVSFEDIAVAFASKSDQQLRKTYWLFKIMNKSRAVNLGTFFLKLALKLNLPIKNLIRSTIFEQFCGGETISDCEQTITHLGQAGIGTILDYSVEGEETESCYDLTLQQIILTIEKAAHTPHVPFAVFKLSGIAPTELLEAYQREESLNTADQAAFDKVVSRLDTLCSYAYHHDVRLFIDAEESWIQGTIDQLASRMMAQYNRKKAVVFNTYQMYRSESLQGLKSAYLAGREQGYHIGAKLVRGAYMEKERLRARENNYSSPIHATKEATDIDYNAAIEFCLEHLQFMAICMGTHNEYSCQYCISRMKKIGLELDDERIWFAQLLGMSDNITYNLAQAGYNTAKYVPYGPIASVMPYLIRRARENTAMTGQSSREYLLTKNEMERRGISSL
ncbi:proline dehydrogenase [Dyadobacter jejuensis]|uniref:Proline dehydrogenase n=1 Tax=Dyadobacter jejuensis TaxID=1082580 RepID=A0A316AKL5_9BACT|nr:proline dehydrogenase family protein [Dyadobacter jejuensis]PWJ57564.1 proline dehydrogenase [Dyadobacter jejuensis]